VNDPGATSRDERQERALAEGVSAGLLNGVADWIMEAALADTPVDQLLGGACSRLLAAGVPLARAHMSYRTLHPSIESVSLVWTPGAPVRELEHSHGAGNSESWRRSPFFFMIENGLPALRRRLEGPAALRDFDVLDDLAEAGMTDYLALMVRFDHPTALDVQSTGIVTSWATSRPSGFVEADIAALLRVKQRLGVAAKLAIKNQISRNVVSAYLGPRAGAEVLNGRIRRGDGQTIHSVIWYSDLRGSSALADSMPSSRYIALLNGYFECAAGAVIAAGGEVLNYIGDGVLAIFPMDGAAYGAADAVDPAAAAIEAAVEARRRLADVNANLSAMGAAPLEFGIGLHVGDVVFGNIGAGARLAFTTIGAAVNEVARVEEMTKTLGAPILLSGEFKAALGARYGDALHAYGFHELRGIGAPLDLYGFEGDAGLPRLPAPGAELRAG